MPGTTRCEWFTLFLEPRALRDESSIDPVRGPGRYENVSTVWLSHSDNVLSQPLRHEAAIVCIPCQQNSELYQYCEWENLVLFAIGGMLTLGPMTQNWAENRHG